MLSRIGALWLGFVGLLTVILLSRFTPSAPPPLNWLTRGVCEFPCWRGIVPGETPFLEAARLLRTQPDIYFYDGDQTNLGSNYFAVIFLVQTPKGHLRGVMTSVLNGTRVQYIYLYPRTEEGESPIPLAAVIQIAGQPSGVMADANVGALVRFHYGTFEAINYPWTFYIPKRGCNRLRASTGLLLGNYQGFEPWDQWHGFDQRFDTWCRLSR
jgi:hypothetical protein